MILYEYDVSLGLSDAGKVADWDGLIISDQTLNMAISVMMKIGLFVPSSPP